MNQAPTFGYSTFPTAALTLPSMDRCNHFRRHFSRSLMQCIHHGFSVEECFGMIWEETLEEIPLPEHDQSQLYTELIHWARQRFF